MQSFFELLVSVINHYQINGLDLFFETVLNDFVSKYVAMQNIFFYFIQGIEIKD